MVYTYESDYYSMDVMYNNRRDIHNLKKYIISLYAIVSINIIINIYILTQI